MRHALGDREDMSVVGEASNVDEVLHLVTQFRPDVVLADLFLPDHGVLDLLRRLGTSQAPAVAVTGEIMDGAVACRVLDAGALAYITHNAQAGQLATAVRTVARGTPYLGADVIAEVAYRRVNASRDPLSVLSSRELEILKLITEGRPLGEVAKTLSLSPRSIANYQTHIKRKLGVATTAALVHLALRHHIIQVVPDT